MENAALAYASAIEGLLKRIAETQAAGMQQAATLVANAIGNNGILYAFGTGHSHLVAEEVAYRAGGLAPIDAILEPSLTGHQQVVKSEYMERVEGMAEVIFDYYAIRPTDALVVISNSGRNAAPIEMADLAQQRGVPVIAITSLEHSKGTDSRHSGGKKLYQVADVVIDNGCPRGDCLLHLPGMEQPIGPGSGVTGMFILHSILVQATEILLSRGIQPPVFMSGNLDGSDAVNRALLKKYAGRIRLW
jgi:uncharacterized phosphosugar-binding protein